MLISYAELLEKINLFHVDANFTTSILPHLTMWNLFKKEIVFREGDLADEGTIKINLSFDFIYFLSFFYYIWSCSIYTN